MNQYQKFLDSLQDAIETALDKGTPARVRVGGKYQITIDIYEKKSHMQVFDNLAAKPVENKKSGIVLV